MNEEMNNPSENLQQNPDAKEIVSVPQEKKSETENKEGECASMSSLLTTDITAGFIYAIPFLAVAATTLKNGAALSVDMALVMLLGSLICYIISRLIKLPRMVYICITSVISILICTATAWLIHMQYPEVVDALGIYLYLPAAYPVIASVFGKNEISNLGSALKLAFMYTIRFTIMALGVSLIREILGYGQIWGVPLSFNLTLVGIRMTFFGIIMLSLIFALMSVIAKYKTEHPSEPERDDV